MVSAPAISIPESIDIDLEGKGAGTVVRVEDLDMPKDVEALVEGDRMIVTVDEEQEITVETEEEAEDAVEEAVDSATSSSEGSESSAG